MDDDQALELEILESILDDPTAEPIKLSYGLLKFITENFCKEIGHGGFGVVYQGDLRNGLVAVKKITNVHTVTNKQFMDEIKCLKRANHKNIVRFLGYCADTQEEIMPLDGTFVMAGQPNRLLCFEYVPNGNIRQYLERENTHGDDWHARYKMIRGICQGLHFLHDNKINHRDLKPENVMLDAHMEPKITDLGLSRFLDQGKSVMISQCVVGTLRYIAPEIIDKGEISFKADIYALGIIIIELLSGVSMTSLGNWEESLDVLDCPRARSCTEIARNCTDRDKDNRPTIGEIMSDLDELERMIPWPSINQVTSTTRTFPGNELLDVYPLELRFPFVPNQEMHCHLSLTNNTDFPVCWAITPGDLDRHMERSDRLMRARCTMPITLHRAAEEELPSGVDKYEILVLTTGCDDLGVLYERLSTLSLEENASGEDIVKAAHESLGFELHRAMLTAAVVVSSDTDRALLARITIQEVETDDSGYIVSIDVHPTEPWVLIVETRGRVCIWNWQTNGKIGVYEAEGKDSSQNSDDSFSAGEYSSEDCDNYFSGETKIKVAKFIARKEWVVIGDMDGSILVRTCPTMDHLKRFKAHRKGVTGLTVHPTRPFLLSTSRKPPGLLRLWDWSRNWSCTGSFDTAPHVMTSMFNRKYPNSFACFHDDGTFTMWKIDDPFPISRSLTQSRSRCQFTYIGDRHFIAFINPSDNTVIWDLHKQDLVHTLGNGQNCDEDIAVACHPTRPIIVTASDQGAIYVWDSITYRLKKFYENLHCSPLHIAFTGSSRLVIGYKDGISVLAIDLE